MSRTPDNSTGVRSGGVIEIANFSYGLPPEKIIHKHDSARIITGDTDKRLAPAVSRTNLLRPQDHNGPKPSVLQMSVTELGVEINTGITDYHTLWGLPGALQSLFSNGQEELFHTGTTGLPFGVGTHNIVLIDDKALIRASSPASGYSAGRLSLSFEEQAEPKTDKGGDKNIVDSVSRGAHEELGIVVPESDIYTLGIGMEETAAYVTFCNAVLISNSVEELSDSIKKAPDYRETTAMYAIPLQELDLLSQESIISSQLRNYQLSGANPSESINFKTHSTTLWRLKLLREFLSINFGYYSIF